jgi:carboxyl-terminal processing protease
LGLLFTLFVPSGSGQNSATLDRKARVEIFDRVWNAVLERYYDRSLRGVDWSAARTRFLPLAEAASDNAEFYRVLRRMLALLGDAHTRVYAPEDGYDRMRPAGVSVGVLVRRVEGEAAIAWVEPGSEAAQQGLRPGLIVKSVDGVPAEDALARAQEEVGKGMTSWARETIAFDRLFYGPRQTTVDITVADENGSLRAASLKRRFVEFPRRVIARRLPNDIGYIELTGFAPEIEREFDTTLESMRGTRGLIIDLRQNGGGFVSTVVRLASRFFPDETSLGEFVARSGERMRRRTERHRAAYREPVVVLVSARSASGAEMFAAAMQEQRRALVVGVQPATCGCLVGVSRTLNLPDGGRLNISDTDYRTARGQRIEGVGVRADEVVELRLADLRARRDRALEWAVDHLPRTAESRALSPLSTPRSYR